jgi:hypothetical protein
MSTQMTTTNSLSALSVAGSIKPMLEFATHLVRSGFLPTAIKTPEQAVAIILTGNELGIPPMQALRQIHVIQGKPTMSAELMLGFAYSRIPGFVCNITESNAERCIVQITRPNHAPYTHCFTILDAKNMGLTGKDNWNKQPAVMLRWRCISGALKVIAPDAIAGFLTPEELNPDVVIDYETGEVIDQKPASKVAVKQEVLQAEPEPAREPRSEDCISEAQQRLIFVTLKKHGIEKQVFKAYIFEKYGVRHTDELKKTDVNDIIEWMKSNAPVQ